MIVSVNWLKKFTDISVSIDELTDVIGAQIAEIESVEDYSVKYSAVKVAEITKAEPHPEADKLGVYEINLGNNEALQVVAGDRTLAVGDKVAHIPPGSIVPNTYATEEPFTLGVAKLRGLESNGMLASAKELDWGDDHEGVLKLDTDASAGTSLIDAYELDDYLLEVENKTLTHRPDCFGMMGFAREVAAVLGNDFSSPEWYSDTVVPDGVSGENIDVSITEGVGCSRYTALVMNCANSAQTPILMQSYLSRIGIRPISVIVDVTNFIMAESAQPMHAFDYDKLRAVAKLPEGSDDALVMGVRHPNEGEQITLLGDKTITPRSKDMLITVNDKPVALGGVMGGNATEVDENTTRVLLEVATFNLYDIRRTSMAHGLFTDAVTRYIRGQSSATPAPVAARAVSQLESLAGASVASAFIDEYPQPRNVDEVTVSSNTVNGLLGSELSVDQMAANLRRAEFAVAVNTDELTVSAPFWRQDIHIQEDIIEEIGRIDGYGKLNASLPGRNIAPSSLQSTLAAVAQVRNALAQSGANEQLTFNFVSEQLLAQTGVSNEHAYRIVNSISPELERMRVSLLPSLLDSVHQNIRAGEQEFTSFEVNMVHRSDDLVDDELPKESRRIALCYASSDLVRTEDVDGAAYYRVLPFISTAISAVGTCSVSYKPLNVDDLPAELDAETVAPFDANRAAIVSVNDNVVGVVGEFSLATRSGLKLPEYSAGAELIFDSVTEAIDIQGRSYRPLSKFPSITQDITLQFASEVTHEQVFSALYTNLPKATEAYRSLEVIDSYAPDENTKNWTFRATFNDATRTLSQKEISAAVEQALAATKEQVSVTVL